MTKSQISQPSDFRETSSIKIKAKESDIGWRADTKLSSKTILQIYN